MPRIAKLVGRGGLCAAALSIWAVAPALAQDAAAPAEAAALSPEFVYILNTFSFLFHGALVMWMAAGFAMLEAGLVRKRSVGAQCLKNIGLYAIAGISFYVIGYNLMYTDVSGYFGSFTLFYDPNPTPDLETGYSKMSDWFFQMVFVATACSIVSGALAERMKVGAFFIFAIAMTAFIYPIAGSWQWGGGWLSQMGFSDFAGSTLVHSVGGWAALAGALLLGARRGKYGADGRVHPMPGSSLPLATLGTFILWLGWFGFNGGSQLAMGSAVDVMAISNIYVNTNLAACGGVVAVLLMMSIMYGKIDLSMVLNGALAGLVAITAEPLMPSPLWAIVVGAIGGVIVVLTVPLLDRVKIDDVVGAVPVHLFCGIWGTLAVPFSNPDTSFVTQGIGIVAYGVFTFVASLVVWGALKALMGIRISEEAEENGIDQAELGMEAYPEFGHATA
jgi:Amt family ammonium transporter